MIDVKDNYKNLKLKQVLTEKSNGIKQGMQGNKVLQTLVIHVYF